MRRTLTLLGTLLLAAAVLWLADLGRLRELAAGIEPGWVVLLAVLAPALAAVSAWKWWILLRARPGGDGVPGFWPLLGLYATGQFYNQVLPSNSGGDVVRGELLARRLRRGGAGHDPRETVRSADRTGTGRSAAYASITAERFTGLAVLVAMAVPAACVPAFRGSPLLILGILAGTGLSLAVMVGVLVVPAAPAPDARGGLAHKARAKLGAFAADLRSYRDHPGALTASLALSVVYYAAAVLSVVVGARCFGADIGVWPAAAATGAVLVVSLLPISINGLGLWEASFLATFEALGLGGELGLAVALLIRFRDLLWAVCGASAAAALRSAPGPRTVGKNGSVEPGSADSSGPPPVSGSPSNAP